MKTYLIFGILDYVLTLILTFCAVIDIQGGYLFLGAWCALLAGWNSFSCYYNFKKYFTVKKENKK